MVNSSIWYNLNGNFYDDNLFLRDTTLLLVFGMFMVFFSVKLDRMKETK